MRNSLSVVVASSVVFASSAHAEPRVVADAPPASGYAIEDVVTGLAHPWSIAWLPNGDMLITERAGRLRLVRDGRLVSEPVRGVPDVFAQGQGGLMEVSLHPKFEQNRWLYLTYSAGNRNENHTVLARGEYSEGELRHVETIFEVNRLKSGTQHFGSRIVWVDDSTMLLAIGDGGNPPVRYDGDLIRKQAQEPGAHLGKVLRLTEDGEPAPGNPLVHERGAAPEVFTLGHRNIQGMARDPNTGNVWVTEHGPRGGDELNLLEPGGNYGWPEVTFGREYFGPKISEDTSAPRFEDAALVWVPSKAPSGLEFYSGDAFLEWRGDLFSGGLVTKDVWRIDLDGTRVVKEETIAIGQRVRDVRQGPDGMLYVLTDERNGKLVRIVPSK